MSPSSHLSFFCDVAILTWKGMSFWSPHSSFLVAICCLFCCRFYDTQLVSVDSTGLTSMTPSQPQWEGSAFLTSTVSSRLVVQPPWNKKSDMPLETGGWFYNTCLFQKPATSSASGADAATCWDFLKKQNAQGFTSSLAVSTYLGTIYLNHLDHFCSLHCFQPQRGGSPSLLCSKSHSIFWSQINYFPRMTDKAHVSFLYESALSLVHNFGSINLVSW